MEVEGRRCEFGGSPFAEPLLDRGLKHAKCMITLFGAQVPHYTGSKGAYL